MLRIFSIHPPVSPQKPRSGWRSRVLFTHLPALLLAPAAAVILSVGLHTTFETQQAAAAAGRESRLALELSSAIAEVENAHRGLLLSANDERHEAYQRWVRQVWAVYGELRHVSANQPQSQRQLSDLIGLFQQWQWTIADPAVEASRRQETITSDDAVTQSAALTENIRRKASWLQAEADKRSADAAARAQTTAVVSRVLAVLAPLLVLFCVVGASLWLAWRTAKALQSLRTAADRLAGGDLDARADVSGGAEAGSLAAAFNFMAEQLSERTQRTVLLAEVGETLQACTTFDEACRVLAEVAPRLLPETSGRLSVFNASRNTVLPVASWGHPTDSDQGFSPDDCWSLRKGRVHLHHPPRHSIACHHVRDTGVRNARVCIPMTAQGDPIGVLHLEFGCIPLQKVNDNIELATIAAERFALALANLRLRDSLRDRSIRDPLTGLFNRRYLEETLDREFGRAERGEQPLSMLVIDVDHFKRLNDQHGHEAGDAVLANVGRLLTDFFRTSDIPCRYGGEEFVVVMSDAALVDAIHRAETLLDLVASQTIEHRGTLLGPVTVSIGVASFPLHGFEPAEVLRAADAALYAAKKSGRNRVAIATDGQPRVSAPLKSGRLDAA